MEVEDEFLKTEVPTVVMYHKSFQCCEAEECHYCWNVKYMKPPPTTCYSGCVASEWGGIQKNKNITGLPTEDCPWFYAQTPVHGQLLFSESDTRTHGPAKTIWLLGPHSQQPETTY